ncbi:MAG TPA: hypothetical protein PKL15_07575 [Saprospiraceae bacterium]|nr:hypothetical protein [Saprospiraceae bacterium]
MDKKDFFVFSALLSDVHTKAFGEPLSRLSHSKAQSLSWMVYEATGALLSYKTLGNYVAAVLESAPEKINPTGMTLSILACYVAEPVGGRCNGLAWFKYRSAVLGRQMAA